MSGTWSILIKILTNTGIRLYSEEVQKNKFSLRYKILILLTFMPLVTLLVYLLLAMRIFADDKIAYVFDTTGNYSQAISSQLKLYLNSELTLNKLIFQDYLSNHQFTKVSNDVFSSDTFSEIVVTYDVDEKNKRFSVVKYLEKFSGGYNGVKEKVEEALLREIYYTPNNERKVHTILSDERLFFFEKLPANEKGIATYFAVVLRFSDVFDIFNTSGALKMFLINGAGQVYMGYQDIVGKNIKSLMDLKFLSSDKNSSLQGVEIIKDSQSKEYIVSYSQVGFGDLFVVSTVLRSEALNALDVLLKKSVIFFVLLFAISVIVSLIASSSLTNAITQLFFATQKVSEGHFDIRVKVNTSDEVGVLADNFNIMASEVSRLLEQTAEKARMENELQTAKTVQETLFPETRKDIGNIEISGFYEPASECGGDWWHYSEVDNLILFWIGDATGHGAPSALITSAAKSAAVIIESLNVGPSEALAYLNKCIYEVSRGKLMMTFFMAAYNKNTNELTYANASHEAPFLIKRLDRPLKKNDLIPLNDVISPRLGQDRDSKYEQATVKLDPNDMIFFYTDGVPDIKNQKNEIWGERNFIKGIVDSHGGDSEIDLFMNKFIAKIQDYRQGTSLIDDVTFFVIKNRT